MSAPVSPVEVRKHGKVTCRTARRVAWSIFHRGGTEHCFRGHPNCTLPFQYHTTFGWPG